MPQRNVASNFTFEQQRVEINNLAQDFWTHKTGSDTAAPTYLKHDGSNAFTGQTLNVPNAFTINSNSGSGTVTISGNLDVTGTTTTVSSANLEVTDKNILISKGSTTDAQADGAGITIDSATDITFNFVDAKDALVSSIGLEGTTFLKAPYGQFTGSGAPSAGQGIEINAPDTNTGQIISYDRGGSAYKELRLKGSSVGIYGGTTNALVGTFNSTGLSVSPAITTTDAILNGVGDTAIRWAVGGTGSSNWDWSIFNATSGGNSTALKVFDNANNSERAVFNADAGVELNYQSTKRLETTNTGITVNGGVTASHSTFGNLNTTGITIENTNASIIFADTNNNPDYWAKADSGIFEIVQYNNGGSNIDVVKINTDGHIDIGTNVDFAAGIDVTGSTTLGDSNTADVLTINGSMIQNNNSSETDYAAKSLPSADSGFYIRNGDGTNGSYASLGIIASNGSSDQSFSIVAKCNNSGLSPDVFFTQRDGNNSQRNSLTILNNGVVGIGLDNPAVAGGYSGMEIGGSPNNGLRLSTTSAGGWAFTDYEINGSQKFIVGCKGGTDGLSSASSWRICSGASFDANQLFVVNSDGSVLPGSDNSQDLGSTSYRWANLYTGDLNLCNEGSCNEVDGTSGSWTMQEGDSDLFLINRKSGKKYKFNLTEVS